MAGGKGVVVTSDRQEALAAIDYLKQSFGAATSAVIVEEKLEGMEVSVS